MKVVVAGGGSVGRFTAEQLAAAGHDVVVVENDRAVVRNYGKEAEAKGVRWHLGDACDVEVLRLAGHRHRGVDTSLDYEPRSRSSFGRRFCKTDGL